MVQRDKTKEELSDEIKLLQKRVAELETPDSKNKQVKERISYFQRAVDGTMDAIGMSTPDGRHYYQNEAFTRLFGLSVAEVDGVSGPPATVYADENVGRKVFAAIIKGDSFVGEVKMLDKDRHEKDVFLRAYPIKDDEDKVIGLVGIHTDITARKMAEEALRHKTAILEAQMNSSIDGILIVDAQGKKIMQNQRAIELWKIPQNIIDNDDDNIQVQYVKNMTRNPERFVEKVEYLYNHPDEAAQDEVELIDGTVLERYSAPVLGKEGQNYGRIWIFHDITERLAQEKRYEAMVQISIDGFWRVGMQGDILDVNDSYCIMIGYSRQELLKMKISDLERDESPAEVQAHIRKIKETGSDRFETHHKRKDGSVIDIEISITFLKSAEQIFAFVRDITERKRAEKALQESEKLYRSLFENTLNGLAYCQMHFDDHDRPLDFTYLSVNDAFKKLTGLNDVVGKKVSEVIPDIRKSDQILLESYGRVSKTGDPEQFEVFVNSLQMWFSVSVYSPQRGFFVSVFDVITERKRMEKELKESKALVDAVIENVPLMIFLKEAEDLRFVIFNRAGEELLGYDRKDLLGKNNLDLFPPEQAAHFMADDRKVLEGESGILDIPEEPILTAKKGQRWLHTRKVCIKGIDGATKFLLGISEDITERRCAEDALRESEERLKDVTFSMADWVWEVDKKGVYTYSSHKGSNILGRSSEEIVGKTPFDFMPPDEAKRVAIIFSAIAAKKAPIIDLENRNIKKNGEIIWILTNGVPILDKEGKLKGYRGVNKDITERKKMQEELLEAAAAKAAAKAEKKRATELEAAYKELQRTKDLLIQSEKLSALGEMSAGIAHELNNPLTGILGIVRHYMEHKNKDDREYGDLKEVIRAGERMAKIMKDLLDFSRPSRREKEELNCNDIIEDTLSFGQRAMAGKEGEVRKNYQKDLPLVKGDRVHLQQVVIAMMSNAFDAMRNNGTLNISTRSVPKDGNNFVEMEFMDSGCGIKKEDLPKIFDPFFTTKRPDKGTGLGLSIAYSIIKDHNGNISVESPPAGQKTGTSFKIRIPAVTGA